MSFKPVEFQVMIPKAPEMSRIHKDEMNKNQAFQQQQAVTFQEQSENHLKQVYKKENAMEARIQDKQEKQDRGGKKQKKKGANLYKNGGVNNKEAEAELRTSTIDIKI